MPLCFVPHLADGGTCSLFSAVKFASDCELKDVHASRVVYHKKGLRSVGKSCVGAVCYS